ncbi:unnamed protein product [Medioppia subpectinata]|uniref:Uncharacterized protein n=1 Tax=Medioppia subpectinata TaxID=1979941 RepID=A0A7R9PT14_9ACAR|nr:unnamed protein product [Medioppia subpectinata]CAG2100199.1 unnamed protein product [Medioppia subpectinata]
MKFVLLLALFSIVKGNQIFNKSNDFDIHHYKDVIQSRNFTDKVVLITGSSSGIGEGIAKLFAVLGAKVVVTGRKEADVHKVALELEKLSPYKIKPLEVAADLTESEDINRLVEQTIKTFGKLDVLVNNAGAGKATLIGDPDLLKSWDFTFGIDLRAVVELTHTAVPYLEKTNGTIIDTSSIAGIHPIPGSLAYNCAKAGLNMLAKVLALELGPRDVIQSRNFTDKVVLVTGSSSGIGEGIAKLFAVLGAKVVVTARKEADVHKVALELEKLSPYKIKPLEIVADLTKSEDITRLVDQTIKTFGKLDVLVNNAGGGASTYIWDSGLLAAWDQIFNINLRGVVELIHTAVPHLEKTNGTIIDTSSIAGIAPMSDMLAYSSAKAALTMLAKVLALELGSKGIRVNTLSPGYTEVNSWSFPPELKKLVIKQTPLKRLGEPLDMAKAVAFLASSDADFITGANIVVDGGIIYNLPSE